jgi:DNA-binding NtrC family response regulator
MQDGLVVDRAKLVRLVEGMKVWELVQLAGTTVEAVVSRVVIAGKLPAFPGLRGHRNLITRRRGPKATIGPQAEAEAEPVSEVLSEPEPELGRLLGQATRQELKEVIDRWVLGRVLAACEWNITHAANRLEVSRRKLRQRWKVVRRPAIGALVVKLASSEAATDLPAGPSLAELLERGATHREIHRAVERWIVGHTLHDADGNVTQSARTLGISRRALRKMRDEAGAPVSDGLER